MKKIIFLLGLIISLFSQTTLNTEINSEGEIVIINKEKIVKKIQADKGKKFNKINFSDDNIFYTYDTERGGKEFDSLYFIDEKSNEQIKIYSFPEGAQQANAIFLKTKRIGIISFKSFSNNISYDTTVIVYLNEKKNMTIDNTLILPLYITDVHNPKFSIDESLMLSYGKYQGENGMIVFNFKNQNIEHFINKKEFGKIPESPYPIAITEKQFIIATVQGASIDNLIYSYHIFQREDGSEVKKFERKDLFKCIVDKKNQNNLFCMKIYPKKIGNTYELWTGDKIEKVDINTFNVIGEEKILPQKFKKFKYNEKQELEIDKSRSMKAF